MTITTSRQYIDSIDACIYIDDWSGEYVYHDIFGYRTYKTLRGLNNYLQKCARMMNRDVPTITE